MNLTERLTKFRFANTITETSKLRQLYLVAIFIFWASMYTYAATLPVYASTIVSDLTSIGAIVAMYGLWQAVVRLPLGIAADLLGRRKPFILVGFLLSAVGSVVMVLSDGAFGLGLGRSITSIAAACWVPLVVAYSSLYPPEEAVKAAAMLTLVNSVSRMIATGLNGPLNTWGGYPLAFYLAIALALIAVFVLIPIREKRSAPRPWNSRAIAAVIVRRDVLIPSLLSAVAQYITWAAVFTFIPILAKDMGAGDLVQGFVASLNIGMMAVGNFLAAFLVRIFRERMLIIASFVIVTAGVLITALAPNTNFLFAAAALIGIAIGVNYPILMGKSIERVPEADRATAMGVYQSIYAVGMFAGPWLSGIIATAVGIQPMFAITGFVTLVLGLLGTNWLAGPIQKS